MIQAFTAAAHVARHLRFVGALLPIVVLAALVSACHDGSAEEAGACTEELAAFEADVYRPVLAVRCIGCHAEGGVAGDSRLVLPRLGSADSASIAAAYDAVRSVALEEIDGQPVLLLRPTATHPDGHPGGRVIQEGSAAYLALARFAVNAANDRCDSSNSGGPPDGEDLPGAPLVRRLTPEEYDASVLAVLGVTSDYGHRFQPDPVVDGHANLARNLVINPVLFEQLAAAAEDIAARMDPARLDPCALVAPVDEAAGEACARTILTGPTVRRLARRPLSMGDVDRFLAVYRAGVRGDDGSFDDGIRWMVEALLQSPMFLYRSELGTLGPDGTRRLDSFEVVTELSYMLTGAPPDDTLLDLAAAGELTTPDLIAEAERLLATEAHQAHVGQLATSWLALEALDFTHKAADLHPDFTDEVRTAMRSDFESFVRGVVFDGDGTLGALLTARVASPGSESFLADSGGDRHGLLTTPALLTVHSRPDRGSPTLRGRLVRERFLCQPVQPPPPDVDANPPPPAAVSETFRERMERHASDPACAACHTLMDPIGFGLDGFDEVGRRVLTELDLTGQIIDSVSTDGMFNGIDALATQLADSEEVRSCVASQWFTLGTGLTGGPDVGRALDRATSEFEAQNGSFEALFLAVVGTRHFVERADPDEMMTVPPDVDAGTSPADAGTAPDAGPAPDMGVDPPRGVVIDERIDAFTGGACHHFVVRNPGDQNVEWSIVRVVAGTITNSWNLVRSGDTGSVTFRGEPWNRVARPGDRFEVGYCMSL